MQRKGSQISYSVLKTDRKRQPAWQRQLSRFFRKPAVEISIGMLIIISVVLTLIEFTLSASTTELDLWPIVCTNQLLTYVFVVELFLRYLSILSLRRFLREFWVDLIAVIPSLIPYFGTARLMRLVRLLRLLRLFGFASRFSSNFPYILRRGAFEYFMVCGLLVFTVLLGTGAIVLFEGQHNQDEGMSFQEAFWFNVYSLFAGEPIPATPKTFGGRIVSVGIMFMGLTIFAMFTGTVSAFMVERLRTKGRIVDWEHLHDHIILCGWNSKAEIILEEYKASHLSREVNIAVIEQWENEPPTVQSALQSQVAFLNDDFTRVSALEQAGVLRAKTCIILADTSGRRTEQDSDARTILAALTVEKLNPSIYTCAELLNSEYGSHLEMGHVNDYVVTSEYSAYMLAQAAMHQGLVGVFNELLTYQRGNQFYRIPLPSEWHGRSFDDLFLDIRKRYSAILVAIHPRDGHLVMNPKEYTFAEGDEVVVIADGEITL